MTRTEQCDSRLLPLARAIHNSLNSLNRPATWASVGLIVGAQAAAANAPALQPSEISGAAIERWTAASQRELIIVDAGVENAETLLHNLPAQAIVARLPGNQEPIEAIGRLLQAHPDVRTMHLLSHGEAAELHLAGQTIGMAELQAQSKQLSAWFGSRDQKPEIVLYGCNVAAGSDGYAWIQALAELTGAAVSASTDPTGHDSKGGDWELERSTGLAARAPIFGEQARGEFEGLLATFTVTNTNDSGAGSLRQAVIDANNAPGADDIVFDPAVIGGIILSGDIFINDDLTINGPGRDDLAISGGDVDRIFEIFNSTVTISGLTLADGFKAYNYYNRGGNYNGAAIYSSDSDLTIQNSRVTDNETAYGEGGAIFQRNGSLTITDSAIENNAAYNGNGGGVFFDSSGALQIINSTISSNEADRGNGGGIFQPNGVLTVSGSTIEDNTAYGYGGGIHHSGESVIISDSSTISLNDAEEYSGGGIFKQGGSLTITDSEVSDNLADQSGGGIAQRGGSLDITGSRVYDNFAFTSGGGVALSNGTLTAVDTEFSENTAGLYGAGITINNDGKGYVIVSIEQSTITNNTVEGKVRGAPTPPFGTGGGLVLINNNPLSEMNILNSTISGNRSFNGGSGVSLVFGTYDATVRIADSTINSNTGYAFFAGSGGGILLADENDSASGSLTIRNSTISGNSVSGGFGGGLAAGTVSTQFRNNSETAEPRGIFATPSLSPILIENTTISDNEASQAGGGIALYAGYGNGVSLINSTISGNRAAQGGGIWVTSEPPINRGNGYYGLGIKANFVTLANNEAVDMDVRGVLVNSEGGGLFLAGQADASFTNSIVGDNIAAYAGDVSGTISANFSLIEDTTGATINGSDNLTGIDPALGPLADNGGPTLTHLPQIDSQAINSGDPGFMPPPDTDQRGEPRLLGTRVDMGAVEQDADPALAIAPDPQDFGLVKVGSASMPGVVTLSNTGAALNVDAIDAAAPPFSASGGSCPATPFVLGDGENCTLEFTFSPTVTGAASQTISVSSNDADGPSGFTLQGEGVLGALSITPDPADFGDVEIDEVGGPLAATLQNTGPVSVDVATLSGPNAPFAISGGSCGAAPFSITPKASCTLEFTFSPTAGGAASDSVIVTSDASTSPDTINLTGNSIEPVIELSTGDVNFGDITLGVGQSEVITLTNTGSADLDISDITDPLPPFSFVTARGGSGSCATPPFTLAPTASCDLQVQFNPTASGDFVGGFDIISNAPSSPDTVTLRGTALEPLVVPTLNRWGLMLMGGLMALAGLFGWRRRRDQSGSA